MRIRLQRNAEDKYFYREWNEHLNPSLNQLLEHMMNSFSGFSAKLQANRSFTLLYPSKYRFFLDFLLPVLPKIRPNLSQSPEKSSLSIQQDNFNYPVKFSPLNLGDIIKYMHSKPFCSIFGLHNVKTKRNVNTKAKRSYLCRKPLSSGKHLKYIIKNSCP